MNLCLFNRRILTTIPIELINIKQCDRILIRHRPSNDIIQNYCEFTTIGGRITFQKKNCKPLIDGGCIARKSIRLYTSQHNSDEFGIKSNSEQQHKKNERLNFDNNQFNANVKTNNPLMRQEEEIENKIRNPLELDKRITQCRFKRNYCIEFLEEISTYLKQIEFNLEHVPDITLHQKRNRCIEFLNEISENLKQIESNSRQQHVPDYTLQKPHTDYHKNNNQEITNNIGKPLKLEFAKKVPQCRFKRNYGIRFLEEISAYLKNIKVNLQQQDINLEQKRNCCIEFLDEISEYLKHSESHSGQKQVINITSQSISTESDQLNNIDETTMQKLPEMQHKNDEKVKKIIQYSIINDLK